MSNPPSSQSDIRVYERGGEERGKEGEGGRGEG